MIPFAVVGSERNVIIDGKSVRGRKNRWGVVNVESEQHCEFMHLRNFLTRLERYTLIKRFFCADICYPIPGHTYKI